MGPDSLLTRGLLAEGDGGDGDEGDDELRGAPTLRSFGDGPEEVTLSVSELGYTVDTRAGTCGARCSKCTSKHGCFGCCCGRSAGAGSDEHDRRVLSDVTCEFRPRELVCLMGPAGSGKTTLLDVLSGREGGDQGYGGYDGTRTGRLLVNGRPASSKRLGMLSNFVPRDDALSYSLTVRETLHYAADLRLPQSWSTERKRRRIEELLIDLRLEHCADAIVGSPGGGGGGDGGGGGGADGGSGRTGGITPGERKKTSIAMDLLNNPSVLLVDEPTAGLNAKVRGRRGGGVGAWGVASVARTCMVCVWVRVDRKSDV